MVHTKSVVFTTGLFIILLASVFCLPTRALPEPTTLWTYSISPNVVNVVSFGKVLSTNSNLVLAGGSDGYLYYLNGSSGLPIQIRHENQWSSVSRIWINNFTINSRVLIEYSGGSQVGLPGYLQYASGWELLNPDSSPSYIWRSDVNQPDAEQADVYSVGDTNNNGYSDLLYGYATSYRQSGGYPIVTTDRLVSVSFPVPTQEDISRRTGTPLGNVLASTTTSNIRCAISSDVDLDGQSDFFYSMDDGYLYRTSVYRVWIGYGATKLTVGNFDGDNKPDVAAISGNGDVVAVKGTSSGILWTANTTSVVRNAFTLRFANETSDNIVITGGDGSVRLLNGLNGSLLWSFQAGGGIMPNSVDTIDWNNDGTSDIIAGSIDQTVYVMNGKSGNILWQHAVGSQIYSLKVGDINNDGLNELLLGTYSGNIIALGPLPTDIIPEFTSLLPMLVFLVAISAVIVYVKNAKTKRNYPSIRFMPEKGEATGFSR